MSEKTHKMLRRTDGNYNKKALKQWQAFDGKTKGIIRRAYLEDGRMGRISLGMYFSEFSQGRYDHYYKTMHNKAFNNRRGT